LKEKAFKRWFKSRINNGILEAINSLVQAAKAWARGLSDDKESHHHDLHHYGEPELQSTHMKKRRGIIVLPKLFVEVIETGKEPLLASWF